MTTRRLALTFVGLATVAATTVALAGDPKDAKKPATTTAAAPEMPLPPGWTPADMQACMDAGIPGPMHARLVEGAGVWAGKSTMWMAPGMEPMKMDCTSTVTPMFDGRFIKVEMAGDMPGMGPFNGFAIYGFDNISQKFQGTWIDNCGTMMMVGTGELASDGQTMNWNYKYSCPITKKPTTLREVDRITGKDTKVMEMFGIDPKTGKEFKMMEIAFTRTAGAPKPVTRAN